MTMPRFASGKARVIGQGIIYDLPIPLDPAPYVGAMAVARDLAGRVNVYTSDGTAWVQYVSETVIVETINRIVSELVLQGYDEADLPDPTDIANLRRFAFNNDRGLPGFVWENEWRYVADEARVAEIAEEVAGDYFRVQAGSVEITVGTGGDFATLNEALAWSVRRRPADIENPVSITVRILSGTVIAEQINLSSVDLSHVRIVSDDAEVLVDVSAFTEIDGNGFATFIVAASSQCPIISCIFRRTGVNPVIDLLSRNTQGVRISSNASIILFGPRLDGATRETALIEKFAGFKSFHNNLTMANVNPSVVLSGADLGDAVNNGLQASGFVNIYGSVIQGCGSRSIEIGGGLLRIGAGMGLGFHVDPTVYLQDFRKTVGVDSTSDLVILFGILQRRQNGQAQRGGVNIAPNSWVDGRIYLFEGATGTMFGRHNLLGTVSQSAGAPTGAVIERGSNANGEFVRFADGTQICTHGFSSSASAAVTWTFPAAFQVAPRVTGIVEGTVLACVMTEVGITATSVPMAIRDASGARRADFIRAIAIGRWF